MNSKHLPFTCSIWIWFKISIRRILCICLNFLSCNREIPKQKIEKYFHTFLPVEYTVRSHFDYPQMGKNFVQTHSGFNHSCQQKSFLLSKIWFWFQICLRSIVFIDLNYLYTNRWLSKIKQREDFIPLLVVEAPQKLPLDP